MAVYREKSQVQTVRWPPLLLVLAGFLALSPAARLPADPPALPAPAPLPTPGPIPQAPFVVERGPESEHYSNGLEVRFGYEASSKPRSYRTYRRDTFEPSLAESRPAGIVFHTTESLIAPLEPARVDALARTRNGLLDYVRHDRLYNFVIDRFGQAFRVVPEDQTANHAGNSVWADSSRVFIDLNDSFLGVAFEMKAGESATPAQINAGRLLTQMLRGAYNISDANCVTHAQVSVNPGNLRLGYHTDWGGGFPFSEFGLVSGYQTPIAAVEVFGFVYDEQLLAAIGGSPWKGLLAAEQQILINAAAHGSLGPRYRTTLQQQYRTLRRRNHENN